VPGADRGSGAASKNICNVSSAICDVDFVKDPHGVLKLEAECLENFCGGLQLLKLADVHGVIVSDLGGRLDGLGDYITGNTQACHFADVALVNDVAADA